ncbi:MAG: TonB-dependent receptor plug domain-containing protein [Allosphingosinicella sp.]
MVAALAYQAPPSTPPSTQPSTAADEPGAEPRQPPPPPTRFLDVNGNPLPADVQRDLEAQIKKGTPAVEAPEAAPPAEPSADSPPPARDGEILVSGRRPRGSVIADIPPEREFDALDIDAYGVSNVAELIQALGPQVSSPHGREGGRPITLLNGKRVSSFSEIAEIPAEAIERMEVFPEELALRYGYRADQKVVNIITFEKFVSRLAELGATLPTDGGFDSDRIQGNYFAIRGDTRFDFSAEYSRDTSLLESDRDLEQPGEAPDSGRFRTLMPETERLKLNGLVSGNLFDNVSSTLNGRFEVSDAHDLLGRSGSDTLARDSDTRAAHLGTTFHGEIAKWLWTLTGNYDRLRSRVTTDLAQASGSLDRAESSNAFANANLVLNGSLLELPAGSISTTLGGSVELRDFGSASLRGGISRQSDLSRDIGAVRANLSVPISSRRSKGAAWLGDLSVNASLELQQFSDFGSLRTYLYVLNWSPIKPINLTASVMTEERAPTMEQLGAPLLATPNVRTFDFTRREVVNTIWMAGGNPELRPENRHVVRLGLTARPLAGTDLTLSFDYDSTRVDDPIVPFPIVTPQVEAAFPERFTRGGNGQLLQIDGRPLNLEKSSRKHLRWGLSFVRPLGKVEPGMRSAPVQTYSSEAEARAAAAPGTMVMMVQPGSPMARRLENMASRLYVSFYHTWQLQDEVLLRAGLPPLDLLDGTATDLLSGSRRHRLEMQAGIFKRGLGGQVTVNWQSGTEVRDLGGGGDLTVADLATVNVQLFANLADRFGGAKAPHWLKGARLTFGITNLLNTRPQVRDLTGSTPLNYQSAYLDPIGRFITFGLRKLF